MTPSPRDGRFSWEALDTGWDPRFWDLGWQLYRQQLARVRAAVPERTACDAVPLVDLELGDYSNASYLGVEVAEAAHPGFVVRVADARSVAVLPAGTRLHFVTAVYDRMYEAMGANFWRDVHDLSFESALEGRWGMEALLARGRCPRGNGAPRPDRPERSRTDFGPMAGSMASPGVVCAGRSLAYAAANTPDHLGRALDGAVACGVRSAASSLDLA